MDLGYAVVKGAIQGLAEFLPISSTAHLIFLDALSKKFGWFVLPHLVGEEEFFDIMLHVGTLCSVLVFFWRDLVDVVQAMLAPKTDSQAQQPLDRTGLLPRPLPVFLIVSMVCTIGLVLVVLKGSGLMMQHFGWATLDIKTIPDWILVHPNVVAIDLLFTGCLLFLTERLSKRGVTQDVTTNTVPAPVYMAPRHAILIGLAQGCSASFHGLSRSGSTISTGLLSGLDRVTATRYSFLLSIPVIVAATAYEFLKLSKLGHLDRLDWPVMLVGGVVSGVLGYVCVRAFVHFVARHSLNGFAIYCWIVGAGMFFLFR